MVCTVNRFRHHSALREAAKAHGLSPSQVSGLVEGLPQRFYGPARPLCFPGFAIRRSAGAFLHPSRPPRIFEQASALIGLPTPPLGSTRVGWSSLLV